MLPPGWGVEEGGGEPGEVPKIQPQGDPPATGGSRSGRSRGCRVHTAGGRSAASCSPTPPTKTGSLSHAAPALGPPTQARLNFPPFSCSSATGGSPLPLWVVARTAAAKTGTSTAARAVATVALADAVAQIGRAHV